MNMRGKKDVRQWVGQNVGMTLDQLDPEVADVLHNLATEQTRDFLEVAEQGLRLSRKKANLPPPNSRREVVAFLMEFRVKIQMVHDRVQGVPDVPLFDFGGYRFLNSRAFVEAKMLYGAMGGLA
ncbi:MULTISPECIES: hypothetical protein [Geomonas]|uniref:Uncharacterized protein n=1 Tax=Geomonas diazotrophica TaxID=2843197 RepID=A0ABX8JG66_9BACT|nr:MULTISPECIES: hypothetical protein [Geomonas]QWV96467.1 hypothetical protein KP005_13940 [Geomonas nitrogeniifigens]QXE85513.1 hypothetical protein KP003_14125 [Geomonas nitrogeniifigens]